MCLKNGKNHIRRSTYIGAKIKLNGDAITAVRTIIMILRSTLKSENVPERSIKQPQNKRRHKSTGRSPRVYYEMHLLL